MRSIRTLTGPVVLSALLATTPELVLGQDADGESPVEITCRACRPGTEIQSDQLGEFLAKNLNVAFGTDMRPLSVALRVELISRERGVIGKYESKAVKVEGGKTYPCVKYFCRADEMNEALAPGFGDRRKITVTGSGERLISDHNPIWEGRQCEGATHAIRVSVGWEGQAVVDSPLYVCFSSEE